MRKYNLEKQFLSIDLKNYENTAWKAYVPVGGNILFFLKATRNQFRLITLLGPSWMYASVAQDGAKREGEESTERKRVRARMVLGSNY